MGKQYDIHTENDTTVPSSPVRREPPPARFEIHLARARPPPARPPRADATATDRANKNPRVHVVTPRHRARVVHRTPTRNRADARETPIASRPSNRAFASPRHRAPVVLPDTDA